ncbi:peptide chain release factor 2 [bacterium BMS3Abin15]|nr:peptide chain release factor 2 [bacterium BMS3Abin15]HDZ85622.1 peptide chain release factor 2 [Candidatus Moranbacteria bacterium]
MKEIGKLSSNPDFWKDHERAMQLMKETGSLKNELSELDRIENKTKEISEFLEIIETDKEKKDISKQLIQLGKDVEKLEFLALLGGKYDRNDAILAIHSGAGGVDAQDWAEMLLRMYLRWVDKNDLKVKIIDESRGSEAGIKSATIEIEGDYAYGYLKGEMGVHRLVRLSPFNADNLRQTSFALVEVLPIIGEIKEVEIKEGDLRIDTFKSSGAGGQSVNTTDSAVRITHLPTNIVVSCQSERSQAQNKERAMKVLRAKLHHKYLEEKEKEENKLRGEYHSVEWGSQIRSYVLHPYKMVKDHRTKFETSEAEKVLDGELGDFIESYLKFVAGAK